MASSRVIWICLFVSICLLKPVLLNPIPDYLEEDDESNEIDKEEILGEGDEDYEYVDDPDYNPEDDYGQEEEDDDQDEDDLEEVDEEDLQSKDRKKRDLEDLDDEVEYDTDDYDYEPEDEEEEIQSRVKRDLEDSDDEDDDEGEYDDSDDKNYEPEDDDYEDDDYEDYDDDEEDFSSSNKVKRDLGDSNDPEAEDLKTMESEDNELAEEGEDDGGKPFGVIKLKDVRNPAFIDDMHSKAMEYLSSISKRKND